MAESQHEQIVAALQTSLQGIVGDNGVNYWFTPNAVLRAPEFHAGCLNPGLTTIYVLSPSHVDSELAHASVGVRSHLTVDLAVVTRYAMASEDPFNPPSPSRWTMQTRLEHDAKKRIQSDYKLGRPDLGLFAQVTFTEYVAHATYLDGWAAVFMRVLIEFIYQDAQP